MFQIRYIILLEARNNTGLQVAYVFVSISLICSLYIAQVSYVV